jgi:translation elongation factor EF-1alpha
MSMDGTSLALKLADVAAPAALTERFPFAIVGHVDHGKSSLIGRLLHDTNSLPEGKFAELKAASDKRGGQFEWSFLLDALQAERDQGILSDRVAMLSPWRAETGTMSVGDSFSWRR